MGACAAVPDAGFVLVARAPAGCPVRNNPYATAANSASSTIAAIFCVVFIVRSYPHTILYARRDSGRSLFALSPSVVCCFARSNRKHKLFIFYCFRTLPSSASCKSFICHSCRNCPGGGILSNLERHEARHCCGSTYMRGSFAQQFSLTYARKKDNHAKVQPS